MKDNWDDESEEEEEEKEKEEKTEEVISTMVQPVKPAEQESARGVRQVSVETASDEEETSSESSDEESESETEELSPYQRAKQRIEVSYTNCSIPVQASSFQQLKPTVLLFHTCTSELFPAVETHCITVPYLYKRALSSS